MRDNSDDDGCVPYQLLNGGSDASCFFPHCRERLAAIYNRQVEEDVEVRKILEMKKAAIADAEKRQDEPLDDSKLVDVIFDFLPRSDSVNEQAAPTAFKGRAATLPRPRHGLKSSKIFF